MTTIILTIIGILLAAAAALMVIFYGGDAFNSGTVGAQANQIQNGGTNVVSAVQMYKAERATAPTGIPQLLVAGPNGAYLDEAPALAADQAASLVTVDPDATGPLPARQLYIVQDGPADGEGLSRQVCDRINTNLRIATPAVVADAAAAQTAAVAVNAAKMACYPTATGGVFIARA